MCRSLLIFSNFNFKMAARRPYWIFCFRTVTLVWPWISTPNLSGTKLINVGRVLFIFKDATFKMAAWRPYWIFWLLDSNFSSALNINSKLQWRNTYVYGQEPIDFQWPHFLNGCLVAILYFLVSGRHGFGSVTQVCFGISVSNFMCKSFVAVGRSLMIVNYVAFKMAALWFWIMFNCNPPIAHCYPLLWGGVILVDHWSSTSSFWQEKYFIIKLSFHYSSCEATSYKTQGIASTVVFILYIATLSWNIGSATCGKQTPLKCK